MKKLAFCVLFLFLGIFGTYAQERDFDTAVREAVIRQMDTYPQSTLKDLYKNFFQDKFGPGHLIADTAAAGMYLRKELASFSESDGLLLEETGWEGRFYRVNLSLLKDGTIPYPVFFDAFVRSVNSIEPISIDAWKAEWEKIEQIIRTMNPDLPGYETDKTEINERFTRGEYVGHHSEEFEKHYAPHYRIISREIVEESLRSFLP